MSLLRLILLSILLTACGGNHFFEDKLLHSHREVASMALNRLLSEDDLSFSAQIDEKLLSLHVYYILGQKYLKTFDASINELTLEELYASSSYLGLMAVRSQVEEIEEELIEIAQSQNASSKKNILNNRISLFSKRSSLGHNTVSNVAEKIGLPLEHEDQDITTAALESEIKELETHKEFIIYEKNIEHISHLMEVKLKNLPTKFRPSEDKSGNVTGQEFPSKVWALTFNDGPVPTATLDVVKNLKTKNIKATFFQVARNLKLEKGVGQELVKASMEIGSHSYTHKDLAKVGDFTMQNEIATATEEMEKILKVDIQLYRLPFGSGVGVTSVREMIAKNNLILVSWNVDSLDWMAQKAGKIVERTKKLMRKTPKDAGIILFHDSYKRGVEASAEIMDYLNQDGRRTCSVGKIIKDLNEDMKTVCSQN